MSLKVSFLKRKMVGLGGLEPPTSPLSGRCAYDDNPYSKAFLRVWEIKFPDSSHRIHVIIKVWASSKDSNYVVKRSSS
jgi:hypothetical protein